MKSLFFIFIFCLLYTISFGEEIFVGYLKPYIKKEEDKFFLKRKDPTLEPMKLYLKIMGSNNLEFSQLPEIELKAILFNPKHKKAFINESLLSEGEEIYGYKIKEIREREVTVVRGNKKFVLKIEEGDKK